MCIDDAIRNNWKQNSRSTEFIAWLHTQVTDNLNNAAAYGIGQTWLEMPEENRARFVALCFEIRAIAPYLWPPLALEDLKARLQLRGATVSPDGAITVSSVGA